MSEFILHPKLKQDTCCLVEWSLCRVTLMNDRTWPWLILIPRRDALTELFDLSSADQKTLMAEVSTAAQWLKTHVRADKINVAALGNLVPQLHIHVIARHVDDPAWPAPVWGTCPAQPYAPDVLSRICAEWRTALAGLPPASGDTP